MKPYKKIFISLIVVFFTITTSCIYNYLSTSAPVLYLLNKKLPIYSVDTEEKSVALTFDINWAENDYLEEILAVLDKNEVKATFFIMGKWVTYNDTNTKNFINIKNSGHEIGNHSYVHPMFSKISKDKIEEEIIKTEQIFNDFAGIKSSIFRFPSGDFNEAAISKVEEMGYKCIQWSLDSVDYKEAGADIEYNRVMKKIKPGDIILFHNNAKYTPSNLERIITELSSQGYTFKTISELIYSDGYVDNNGIQHEKD